MQEIEIIHDPKALAIAEGLRLDPVLHEVLPEGEWLKAAKRATERSTLLVYRHRMTGQFVLADLIYEPDVIQELESWPAHPERLGVHMEWVKMRCEPREKVYKRIFSKMREVGYARRALNAESEEQKRDTQQWLRRTGHPEIAAMMAMQPFVGDREGAAHLEKSREELARMAKVT
jgi:hypothetical protein